jgi:hypothetical protein
VKDANSGDVDRLRHAVRWLEVGSVIGTSQLGLPVGISLLDLVAGMDRGHINQVIGAVVLAALLLRMFARIPPKDHLASV